MFCLPLLIGFALQSDLPSFTADDLDNLKLVAAYSQMVSGPGVGIVNSSSLYTPTFVCSVDERNKFLDRFASEFGYDVRKQDANGRIAMSFTAFTISADPPETLSSIAASFRPEDLISKGLASLPPATMVKKLTYYYRPYIDSKSHRTDAVDLTLTFIDDGGQISTMRHLIKRD
jgi:hypothetical protein